MPTKTLYILRHAETEMNRLRIIQGSGIDSDLNERGIAQANRFFEAYQHTPFDWIVASNLKRTQQTIRPFVEKNNCLVSYFAELNEFGWGANEGNTYDPATESKYRYLIGEWAKENYHACIDGGESAYQLHQRVKTVFEHILESPAETILLCSHGRTLRCLLTIIHNQPLFSMEQYPVSNTGLYVVQHHGTDVTIHKENDLTHLAI
jgi:broad specificity phosphatase PhoE